jgi:zinc protease
MDQADPDYPAMVLADRIMGGDEKSRLWVRIREREGLSYGVNSNFSAGTQAKYGTFAAVASVKPENAAKVEAAFKDEIGKAVTTGFGADEVASAKNAFLQERQLSRAQDGSLAGLFVSQAELGRTMAREADLEKRVTDTTPEQLSAIFKKWIDPASISYFKAGDFKKAAAATAKWKDAANEVWRTHSCVPCRDSSRHSLHSVSECARPSQPCRRGCG